MLDYALLHLEIAAIVLAKPLLVEDSAILVDELAAIVLEQAYPFAAVEVGGFYHDVAFNVFQHAFDIVDRLVLVVVEMPLNTTEIGGGLNVERENAAKEVFVVVGLGIDGGLE